jgi:hypothetical protein
MYFRIKVPKRSRTRRGPQYVSASTQGITIAFSGPTKSSVAAGLTPSSPGCVSGLQSTVCSLVYKLKPGKYAATIVTYDAVSCTTSCTIPPGAKALSTAQSVPFTVKAGAANKIDLILSAIPAAYSLVPMTSDSVINAGHGIDLLGTALHKIAVEALDPDGNVIFGAGSPTYTVSQTAGSLAVTLGQPAAASPNVFTVAPPAAYSASTATVAVTASYAGQATDGCAQTGAVCTTSIVFDMKELLAVASTFGNTVDIFSVGDTQPYASISFGVAHPTAVTFDASGDLLVANCLQGCTNTTSVDNIAVFAPPYSGVPAFVTTGVYGPQSLLISAGGNLFVGNCLSCRLGGTDSVTEYAPPFTNGSTPIATANNGVADPVSLALDPSGNLWVADCASCSGLSGDSVTSYASPYTGAPTHTLFRNVNVPVSIAVDASANVFVANQGGTPNVTGFVAPLYTDSSNPAVMTTITSIAGYTLGGPVAVSASGSNVFIADNGGALLECGPPFAIGGGSPNCGSNAIAATSGLTTPNSMVLDTSQNAFVGDGSTGFVVELPPPYSTNTNLNPSNTPNAMAVLP